MSQKYILKTGSQTSFTYTANYTNYEYVKTPMGPTVYSCIAVAQVLVQDLTKKIYFPYITNHIVFTVCHIQYTM